MRVLVIDNYDSFVYNLVQYVGELGGDPLVYRNDKLTIEQAMKIEPSRIILSPGPGMPSDPRYFAVCSAILGADDVGAATACFRTAVMPDGT